MLSEILEIPKALYIAFFIGTIMAITKPEAIITLDPESFIASYGRLRNS
jgi:hypothetical protein